MKKKVAMSFAAAALAVGGWYLFSRDKSAASSGPEEIPPRFITKAEKRDIDFSVQVSGDVTPAYQLIVKPEVGGKIKALHVEAGDTVKEGDVLAEIDDRDLLTEKQSVLTEIDGAKLSVNKAQRNFQRARELFDSKLISREVFDNLSSEFELAQNAFVKAERRLQLVEDKLRKTKVISPMNGSVLTRPVIEGEVAIAAASVNSGTTLMTLADLSKLLIVTHVNQVDVAKLSHGQLVKLRAEAMRDIEMDAKITRIALVASPKNNIKGFEVEALIEHPSERLRPGMSVNMRIPIAQASDAVSVPISAVFKGEGNQKVVYVREGAETHRREVKVGVTNIEFAQILNGVTEGETILLIEPDRGAGAAAAAAKPGADPARKRS